MTDIDKNYRQENYLLSDRNPLKTTEEFYHHHKTQNKYFSVIYGEETHTIRRRQIMNKYPEISKLFVLDKSYTIIITLLMVPISLLFIYLAKVMCNITKDAPWPIFLGCCFMINGTLNHSSHLLIHDLTHNLGHRNSIVNKLLAIYVNIPMVVPTAVSFGKYHAEHHRQFGIKDKDPDLPLVIFMQNQFTEATIVKKWYIKIFYLIFLALIYSFRPVFSYQIPVSKWEAINIMFMILVNLLIYQYWGSRALIYMTISLLTSIGLHPASLHVMAQHYEMVTGMETYNYIGFWNYINFNVGYHIQHHDFPHCPWYNLPKISKIAPQFYDHLPYHTSYFRLMIKFITDKNFNVFNRTIRIPEVKKE